MNIKRLTLFLMATVIVQELKPLPVTPTVERGLVMPSLRSGAQLNNDYRRFNSRPHTTAADDLADACILPENQLKEDQLKPLSAEAYAKQQMQKSRAQELAAGQNNEVASAGKDPYAEKMSKEQFFEG